MSPEKIKTVLHTIDTTGPGGAETVFIDLASRLQSSQYRSRVVIRAKGWVYDELCRRGFEPLLLDAKGSFNVAYLRALVQLVRSESIDVIQSHLLGSNVYCSLAGLLTRTPVVTTFHGGVDIGDRERFKGLKFAAINAGACRVVAVSANLRDEILARTPLNAGKTQVIYNGIDTAAAERPPSDALRTRYGWGADDVIIGSLGNVRRAKAYDILLQAAAELVRGNPRLRFVIAGQGKGGLYDALLTQRAQLGLESHVEFLGFVADPADYLSNLDMFLLSSTSEGFSIATIQAMAAGLPVVVTRSGGPQEIVTHGVNGWMVEPGDAGALAAGVRELLAAPALAERLAGAGRTHALETFDIGQMLQAYRSIYDSVC